MLYFWHLSIKNRILVHTESRYMRNLTPPTLLYVMPCNYKGLKDNELLKAIRKHSTIDLPEPVLFENLELVIERYSKPELMPSLSIFYYGKDIENNNEVLLGIASETLYHFPCTIHPTLHLMEEKWKDTCINQPLEVTRIGFCKLDEELSISVSVRVLETEDNRIVLHI
jgi:hypothetical protein